jgi:hypothetical protein
MITCALAGLSVVVAARVLFDQEIAGLVAIGLPGAVALGAGLGMLATTRARLLVLPAGVASAFLNALLAGLLLDAWLGFHATGFASGLSMAAYGAVLLSPVLAVAGALAGGVILWGTYVWRAAGP